MPKPVFAGMVAHLQGSLVRFRKDERGSMTLIILFTFLAMIMFGGIAIDVMRFETRRVANQQTLDRAVLAAASLTQTATPQSVVADWYAKTDLDDDLPMVEFAGPEVASIADAGLRRVTASARVRSYNFFMSIFSPNDYLQSPTVSEAAQGVSQIEVMLVLDITGSMGDPAVAGQPKTKIVAMREAAQNFVNIVKANDKKDGVSIGVVPYAAQVNVPSALRAQFTVSDLSTWGGSPGVAGIPLVGVPNINCLEFPTGGFNSTAVSLTTPIPMAAVADTNTATTTTNDYVALGANTSAPVATARACTTNAETNATTWVDAEVNQVLLPTKDPAKVNTKISRLTAGGNTYIAVGMRWGTALLDQAARPIYTNLLGGEPGMAGRPADNTSIQTRKIIILMTDGEHVTNNHVFAFRSGPSPIWRGTDGNFAIRYTNGGAASTGGARPTACSGWTLAANREYFVPHLKRNSVKQKKVATEVEGQGTGTATASACDPLAWIATTSWTTKPGWGAYDANGVPLKDAKGNLIFVPAVQLDWSEVWANLRVSWVGLWHRLRGPREWPGANQRLLVGTEGKLLFQRDRQRQALGRVQRDRDRHLGIEADTMTRIRQFARDESGTATIEFVFIVPVIMLIFMASFESSLYMIRHVMLERSVDLVVRDIRLGKLDDISHADLKKRICETSALVNTVSQCIDSMKIWMQPINTADFAMVAPPRNCVDRSEPIDPLAAGPPASEFKFGDDNEIMLLRICLKEEPMFPTTIVGAGLIADGEGDGNYALVTTSVFVNEPG
ncbi:MAG: pilus assembly protein TadG-related protein [Rhodobacterales bacterium]|nr:pilus assembly protein TadG-related protein [Rhodobacterales bacterium]